VYSRHAGHTEADPTYRPNSEVSSFDLPAFKVPLDELSIYLADPDAALARRYLSGDEALFCVHPQLLDSQEHDLYLTRILSSERARENIEVSPTSSTRTLWVREPGRAHALKVHFPFRVSRYGRRMRDEVVEQAINVSRQLQQGIGCFDSRFGFLREVLGVTYRDLDSGSKRGENWGYLVRDLEPFPTVSERRPLVPGFSLYGGDFFEPEKPLLIFELIGERDPLIYVLEQIMLPIIRHWVEVFLGFGLLLEPHGQNVLLEIGADGEVARIVYRDLNLGIDCRRRRDLRLPVDLSNTYNQMDSGDFNSITYDKFMGGHFFDRLVAALVERVPGLKVEDFRGPCREEFARLFPEHRRYLPRTIQYFSEERDEFGKPLYQDTGQPPVWRP
jgi:hypothetical protein